MNNARPIPTGARYVLRCFSAANMKMVKTSSAVKNISMKRACVVVVPAALLVPTFIGPGNKHDTTAAADMHANSWAMNNKIPRTIGVAPTRTIPRVTYPTCERVESVVSQFPILTAGLKRPPLIRKNAQTLTAREKPKARLM